jgi:putative ABC transport system permease protein
MSLARILTLRSLRSRPSRMLLSMFGIVLGVAAILAIGITNQTALQSVTRLFKDTAGSANLIVVSAGSSEEGLPESLLPRLQGAPGIEEAVPSLQASTVLAEEAGGSNMALNFFGTSLGGLTLYGIDADQDKLVRDYKISAGKFLSQESDASEVVLVDTFSDEKEITVGDTIAIATPGGVEKLRVVGLMAKEGPGQTNNGAFGVIPLLTAQKLFSRQNELDQVDLVVKPELANRDDLQTFKADLQARLGEEFSVIYPATQGERMTQMLGSYQIGLNFLSGTALFVGIFLIYNAFSMSVVERTREFGMLRTIGMTRAQVTRQVLSEAAVLGLIGSLLGAGLGVLLARGLSNLMGIMLAQDLTKVPISSRLVISGVTIGLLASIGAAAIPAYQAGRISALEALRIRGNLREGWLIRKSWQVGLPLLVMCAVILIIDPFPYDVQFRIGSLVVFALFVGGTLTIPASVSLWDRVLRPVIRTLYGNSGRLGSANIQRAKLRTTLTVAALMIGVSMIIIIWVMTDSFKGDLEQWLEGYIGGDLYVTSSLPMGRQVWRRLESVDGVQVVAPVRYFEVNWRPPQGQKEAITFMAVDPASYSRVTSFVFSESSASEAETMQQLAGGEAVFISSVLAEKYNLGPGDQISLLTRIGERQFKIAAVVVDYYNQGLVVSGSWGDMERYFRLKDANAFLLKASHGSPPEEIQERIENDFGKRDHLVVESNQALLDRVSVLMQQAFSMFDVLALIAVLVGFMGIANTLTMNVMERTQEIGMLRSVGMTRGQVIRMVLAEAAQIGLMGGLLGLIFGIILSRIFMLAMTTMSGYHLVYTLSVERVLVAVLVALLVSQVAAMLPAVRASRTPILDAIQYE